MSRNVVIYDVVIQSEMHGRDRKSAVTEKKMWDVAEIVITGVHCNCGFNKFEDAMLARVLCWFILVLRAIRKKCIYLLYL